MEQSNSNKTTPRKHYKHLVRSNRYTIEAFFRSGTTSRTELARIVGVHPFTIRRELKRGAVINYKSNLETYVTYSAEAAQQRANEASAPKGPRPIITTSLRKKLVHLIIVEKRSPEDALAVLKDQGETNLPCFKTVYNAIHHGDLSIRMKDLPYRRIPRKGKAYPQNRRAYTAMKNTSIEEWTEEISKRLEIGHYEIDLVMGGRGTYPCLLTVVDRKTRMLYAEKLPAATQVEVERGLKKYANRIIRRFIPKGSNMNKYSRPKIKAIESHINSIHRGVLGGLTAQQAHANEMINLGAT